MSTPQDINPLELDRQICFALHTASRLVGQAYQPILKPLKLTYLQYIVMLVLWEMRDNPTVNAIGQPLKLDSGTLSPLLKKLEGKGLIDRTRSKNDERIVHIKLTAKGQSLRKKAARVPHEMLGQLQLKIDELSHLKTQLDDLNSRLSSKLGD
jgi:MarR family transcriptional regulator, organic hydroperoxide resistance regulator